MEIMQIMRKIRFLIITSCTIICVLVICLISRTPYIFIGNSYEGGKNINVVISLNDTAILYDGLLKSYELPMLFEKREMKIGIYKISVYFKDDNKRLETKFLYLFQTSIWIDFDMNRTNPLLVSCYYRQIPL